jgi:hypothetical protein
MKISEICAKIKDKRGYKGRIYSLWCLAGIILYGLSSGKTSAESIERYARERLSASGRRKLGVPEGRFPSGKTLRRIMERAEIVSCKEESGAGKTLAMDGKSSRLAKSQENKAPHILNLYDVKAKESVARERCEKGSGTERKAAKRLIERIGRQRRADHGRRGLYAGRLARRA